MPRTVFPSPKPEPSSKRELFLQMRVPSSKRLPPDNDKIVLTWDANGVDLERAFIVRQHILEDRRTLGCARVLYWLLIPELPIHEKEKT